MEFLLQFLAELFATPTDEEVTKPIATEQEEVLAVAENKEVVDEEPAGIFGLMQFH